MDIGKKNSIQNINESNLAIYKKILQYKQIRSKRKQQYIKMNWETTIETDEIETCQTVENVYDILT